MFPPPWTARDEIEEEPMNMLTRSRQLQDLENTQHLPGRILSNQTCWRKRRARLHGASCASSTLGEHSTSEMPRMKAHMEQVARDSCLSIPKHPPKFSMATHGYRLFGEAALLPLQSQARARARSEATTSTRSAIPHTDNKYRGRAVGWRRAASNRVDGVRRTAWGDDEGRPSVGQLRHAIYARRAREEAEAQPEPEPEPEPDDSVSHERPVSEDSRSTHALVYGNELPGEASLSEDELCPIPRPDAYGREMKRNAFFSKFREMEGKKHSHPTANVTTVEEENERALAWEPTPNSSDAKHLGEATAKFLRKLSDHGRAPWPAILRWSKKTRAIEVGGMGLGDDIVVSLATVLPILRNVERLVAFDNRMTDLGTYAVVKAVQGMPALIHLDLSENEIGALAAHELREYMRNRRCKLRSLAIRKADIDDDECREFMAALGSNDSLLEVDLAENLIGNQETQKVTGAGSVATMLSTNCTLTSLNLGWNSLRMDSAVTVAKSLRHNHTLTTLGLAYNRFSDYASQMLAVSLFENDTLTHLDLSYNSVTPSAALVFAFALEVNTAIEFLQLEGNRIGENGGEALVTAMRVSHGNLLVGMTNCDTSHRDETLFSATDATGQYNLDLQVPYQKVVACELLKLANRKPTCHFRSLKHVLGKRVVNVKLRRADNAVAPADPRLDVTRRIEHYVTKQTALEQELFVEYAKALGMKPEPNSVCKLVQIWNEVLARDPKLLRRESSEDPEGDDFATRTFFESLFSFADKNGKGELNVEDLEALFRALHLPYGEARMRHVMSKYDADRSGSVDLQEFTHYMSAAHLKQRFVQHGHLCTEDGHEWQVPASGKLRVTFIQEPSSDRTLGEISTDRGVEGLIANIRQSPTDDTRKRLFELATSNSGIYFTLYQAQGLLEAISSNYHIVDAVATLMPCLASSHECASFVDSNLDHRQKVALRFVIGGAWGPMMGLPSGHYSLDMQNARDRLTGSKIAAVANQERQYTTFNGHANTSQHGNWQNFRNAEYNHEPIVLTSAWFINMPTSGVLRFDYASTSIPDHHQVSLPEKRFQRVLERLGVSMLITSSTPIDEEVIGAEAFREFATSHWRKSSSSSPIFKLDQRDYYRSGSSLDDVSLASWWSAVEVTSVDMERKSSFAHLEPSETYMKAFYKLKELEVALVSACLTADQLARLLENFPREGQLRADVVVTFYHKVTDIDHMCLLIDALRPDEEREILARRGHLNCINPVFADRYYRLDLSVWDEREMAKMLVRLAIMEPGENWLEETFQRHLQTPLIPGWELPLDWTTPDVSGDKKSGGPPTVGFLTLWYSSAPRRGCLPNLLVRQDLATLTFCQRIGPTFGSTPNPSVGILPHTFEWQQRFRGYLDKGRQTQVLLTDEIALGLEEMSAQSNEGAPGDGTAGIFRGQIAGSSITARSDEGTRNLP